MPTNNQKEFSPVRLFRVQKKLNISTDRAEEFLREGYENAISGAGVNARIIDQSAYYDLLEEYAEDQRIRARVRGLRNEDGDEKTADQSQNGTASQTASPSSPEDADETTTAETVDETASPTSDEDLTEEREPPSTAEAKEESEETAAAADDVSSEAEEEEAAPVSDHEVDEMNEPVEAQADRESASEEAASQGEAVKPDKEPEEVEATSDEQVSPANTEEAEEAVPAAEEDEEAVAESTPEEDGQKVTGEAEQETVAPSAAAEQEAADDTVDEEEASSEDVSEEEEEKAEEGKEGTLRANRYRLSGPKQVGQVDMDEIKRKARERRRKRKRQRKKKKKKKKKKRQQRKKKKNKSNKPPKPDEEDIEEQIQQTLQELEQGASRIRQKRRRQRRQRHEEERQRELERKRERANVVRATEYVSTGELANLMGEDVNDLIASLMDAGRMASINQRLDAETIEYLAEEFDVEIEFINEFETEALVEEEEDDPEDLAPRAPVITVMGHVDHGKTSLLDYIRQANVVAGEAGGITQHIGAHRVQLEGSRDITFLDTPGHEAFTAMRARGAKSTDLVILVVAADDSVMPQTVEAINHAQAAEVPIIVAINKMDLPEADPQKVMQELAEQGVLVEDYGGEVQCAQVSAETGEGIDDLLEKVTLQADIMELKANPDRRAEGTVVESHLEKGRGNVATVLVQRGTLSVGDPFVAGINSGRVRAMFDERDNSVDDVGPSQPALVLGFDGSSEAGDQFISVDEETTDAREIAQERQRIHREQRFRQQRHIRLDEIGRRLAAGEFHELNLIIKADVGGSVEAISDSLLKLKTDEVAVKIIHTGVGAITENDVMLAAASDAVIIGFQVRPRPGARKVAKAEDIDVRTYSVIYEAVEDVHMALEGLLAPEEREETLGLAEVRDTFDITGVGTIAGCRVTEGRIHRDDQVRLVRDGVVAYEGGLSSLKHHKDDATEIQEGFDCGIGIENFDDIKEGDEIEAFEVIEERRTLEV